MRGKFVFWALATALMLSAACTHRLQVDPIHITVDVNIKVDRALDDFFSDIDESSTTVQPAPSVE